MSPQLSLFSPDSPPGFARLIRTRVVGKKASFKGDETISRATILIIEKNESMGIAGALQQAGYETTISRDISAGLKLLHDVQPSLTILVREQFTQENDEAFLRFRQESAVPIMVIGAQEHCVDSLESGADTYLNKPVCAAELVALVRSLLRRTYEYSGRMEISPAEYHRLN